MNKSVPLITAICIAAGVAVADMMNARIRFEDSDNVRQADRSMCLNTDVIQTGGDYLVLDPDDVTVMQPANPNGIICTNGEAVSGAVLTHMKELGWSFELAEGGEYEVWMRAWFPLAAFYNHMEQMDDYELIRSGDSVDAAKVDKYEILPTDMEGKWLEPKMWHWFKNQTYKLDKGKHFFHFPLRGAWCGGCLLDRMVLVKKGTGFNPDAITETNRKIARPATGVVMSRRIKTERIARWLFDVTMADNGGKIALEYSYGGDTWNALVPNNVYDVPAGSDYLYIRFLFTSGSEDSIPPYVYSYKFRVEKK